MAAEGFRNEFVVGGHDDSTDMVLNTQQEAHDFAEVLRRQGSIGAEAVHMALSNVDVAADGTLEPPIRYLGGKDLLISATSE